MLRCKEVHCQDVKRGQNGLVQELWCQDSCRGVYDELTVRMLKEQISPTLSVQTGESKNTKTGVCEPLGVQGCANCWEVDKKCMS